MISHICVVLQHVHRPAVIEEVDELDYDPGSTHESTSHDDTSQDTDKLIVSESVKEVRPCVAERFDNDHRCELAEQCISFDSTADEDKPDEPDSGYM